MKIAHFMVGVLDPGGVATYIKKITGCQIARGDEVLLFDHISRAADAKDGVIYVTHAPDLYRQCLARQVDLAHLHLSLPLNEPPPLPTLRTVHGHAPFCPAGTQFLQRSAKPCPHTFSPGRCLVNHFVERCGSIRPGKIMQEFQTTRAEIADGRYLHYTTVSKFMQDRMIRAGYPADRITVNYLPAPTLSTQATPTHPHEIKLLFAGRLTRLKGVDWLISTMVHVPLNITLDIAGDGPERKQLEDMLIGKNLTERVRFHGWVDAARLSQLYDSCTAVVFPSLWHEPAGFVSFEAMARSKPVIAAGVGGIPEVIIGGHNGLIVPPGDVVLLTAAINRLVHDPDYAMLLGANGRMDVRTKFTLERHMHVLDGVYEHCMAAGSRAKVTR